MSGLLGLLDKPAVQYGISAAVVFGVQRLVPTLKPAWYKALKKPEWTPPNYVFPLVWIPLKIMQSIALALTWRSGSGPQLAAAVGTFGVHLFLGNWWNVVFFGQNKLQGSLPWMYAFWGSVAATALAFKPINPTAAALMLPTLAWVTIATKLNIDIVSLNKDAEAAKQ